MSETQSDQTWQVLTFDLDGETFALEAGLVRRDGDLIVLPDLDQIFTTRGGATGAVVPLTQ